jgi:putative cell wall-binding protein
MKKSLTIKSLLLSLILIFIFTIPTLANTPYTRIAGQTRYDTASTIATSGWTQSDYAILCYGENYPDALASAPLAKKYNAPILLTSQNSLPDATKQALTALQVKTVIIVGGTGVISSNIDSQLQSMGINVNRVFGNDKYETAIKVAEQVSTTPSSIFICNGYDFGDALSVAPIASIQQSPIILVSNDSIPSSVKEYIASHNISKSYVIGYSDIVSDSIANQFPNPERITGADKYERNISVDKYFNNIFTSNGCGIATGEQFADALSATAYCAKMSEPLVLANFNSPSNTRNYYQQRMGDQSKVFVFGGNAVLPDSVITGLSSVDSSTNADNNTDNNVPATGGSTTVNNNTTIINNNTGTGSSSTTNVNTPSNNSDSTSTPSTTNESSDSSEKISPPIGSVLCPSGFGFNKNSVDGIKVYWMAKNQTAKTINYYTVKISLYNPVGDPAYDEISGKSVILVKYVGPALPGDKICIYSIIGYSSDCSKISINSIDVQYSDGTTETIPYSASGTETLVQ